MKLHLQLIMAIYDGCKISIVVLAMTMILNADNDNDNVTVANV